MSIFSMVRFHRTRNLFQDDGKNNRVVFVLPDGVEKLAKPKELKNLDIQFKGNNNLLKIHLPVDLKTSTFFFRCDSSIVEIHRDSHLALYIRCIGDNSKFTIGEECHSLGIRAILCGNSVTIGRYCMFSDKIVLYDDTHSVLDYETHRVLNKEKGNIIIGDHCWIGEHVTLLKKAQIPNDCIVGYGSVLTKPFVTSHVLLAGNPAKVVKENITWNSLSPTDYDEKKAKEMRV